MCPPMESRVRCFAWSLQESMAACWDLLGQLARGSAGCGPETPGLGGCWGEHSSCSLRQQHAWSCRAARARTVGAVTALCHRCLQEAQMWSGAEQSLGFAKPASPCVAPRKAERCACRCTWHVQAAWWGCLLPSCPAACLQREETATGLLCLHIRCWPAPHLPAEVVNDTQAQEGPVSILLLPSCQGPLDPHGGVVR